MVFRSSIFHEFLICSCIGVVIFTSACGDPAAGGTQVQAQPTCVSSTPGANPYLSHGLSTNAINIYLDSFINPTIARQNALSRLGENTGHWSNYVDIAIDDAHMVRIVVTYIDPVLVQYIVLNHELASSSYVDLNNFNSKLQRVMNELGQRNEMLFIVTVTSPFYNAQAYNSNVLNVKLPITQMALVNAAGTKVIPTHWDPILNENIDITHGPASGIVGYPLSVINQSQCIWVMDTWSNKLTLDLPSVTLGSTAFGSQFWDIPYRALVTQEDTQPTPTFDPNYDWSRVSRLNEPPTPTWNPSLQNSGTNWNVYWEDMGRYLWDVIIAENYH